MRKKFFIKKLFLISAVCWMAVIFFFSSREADLSSQDSTSVGELIGKIFVPQFLEWDREEQLAFAEKVDHPVRKAAHATEYAVLGFLLLGSFYDSTKKRWISIMMPWAFGTMYAVSDEIHQLFVPGRSCQVSDMALDSCGVIAGVLAGYACFRICERWRRV